jgi:TolB-like protein
VDLLRREIRRQGTVVPAERQAFDLLVYLIENRDRAIEKHELQQAVWAGASVTGAALTQCVTRMRRLVGDDSKLQTIVKTIHGHGYHFVATLESLPEGEKSAATSPPSIERYQEALRVPDRLTVAVLPFKDLGNDPDHAYFAEGISEDVIAELSRFSSLFVIAPTTMVHFKNFQEGMPKLARMLGVTYVVQGTVRRSQTRVRVTVHLTEAVSERRLWSEHYDRGLEEVPIIRDDVARTIAATIGGRVEAHRSRQRFDEADVEAYDLILRAKALHYTVAKEANAEALRLLSRAIELAPNNARAHAWLASVHSWDAWCRWSADSEKSLLLALKSGRKALAMDESDCVAHFVFAEIMHSQGEYESSESHFIRALKLNPNNIAARGAYSLLLVSLGRAEEALQHMAVAERLDPFGVAWTPWVKGAVMFTVGRYQDAIHSFSQIENLQNIVRIWLSAAYVNTGDLDQARIVLEKFVRAAQHDLADFPGKDKEAWRDYLHRELLYRDEKDFDDFIRALTQAGWHELIDALPDSSH